LNDRIERSGRFCLKQQAVTIAFVLRCEPAPSSYGAATCRGGALITRAVMPGAITATGAMLGAGEAAFAAGFCAGTSITRVTTCSRNSSASAPEISQQKQKGR